MDMPNGDYTRFGIYYDSENDLVWQNLKFLEFPRHWVSTNGRVMFVSADGKSVKELRQDGIITLDDKWEKKYQKW